MVHRPYLAFIFVFGFGMLLFLVPPIFAFGFGMLLFPPIFVFGFGMLLLRPFGFAALPPALSPGIGFFPPPSPPAPARPPGATAPAPFGSSPA